MRLFSSGGQAGFANGISILQEQLDTADAVVIGAGSGLSTAAGYTYTGQRFDTYFADFQKKYGIRDMYSGGFYPYPSAEAFWGYWARYIWINRYAPIPSPLYSRLLELVKDKDYFVITTNVDHCFQRAGFDKRRLYYTQGDYGLFQSEAPHGASAGKTYDNYESIRAMAEAEGYHVEEDGNLSVPPDVTLRMTIPSSLVPICPDDGKSMTTNLRVDDSFVEDEGWHRAAARYDDFLRRHEGLHVLYLELGVGGNTPGIIKYPFWGMTARNPHAFYACVNLGEAFAPQEIRHQSVCLDAGIDNVVDALLQRKRRWTK